MTGENYTNTFGGENVSPANLSYVSYVVNAPSFQLTWAFEAVSGSNPTADKIDINCAYVDATVRMPPADQVTVGQDVLFGSVGVQRYIVTDYGGNVICVVDSGKEWFVYLTDNTTQAGVWRSVLFGASTSAGTAADLAGAGLKASGTVIDQNIPTTPLSANYTVTAADRATVLQNDGGGVDYTFPDAGAVGDGWFVYIVNLGTGNIRLLPVGGDTIDEDPNKTVGPNESLIILSDGANFQTVGHGRAVDQNITAKVINAAGAGTLTLASDQSAAQIQDFVGTLTGNRRIEYGAVPGYWFVHNRTDPATPHSMTFATNSLDPGVTIAQGVLPAGMFSILRSNGANMSVAFSDAGGSVVSISTTVDMIPGVGSPITTSGTIGLANTGVTANTYGDASHTSRVKVDVKGRITEASSPAILIPSTQISDITSILPPAMIIAWGAWITIPIPAGWLPCDGSWRLISDFPALYNVIGGAYGVATGSEGTHFVLPATHGCVLMGQDPGYRVTTDFFTGGNPNVIGSHGGAQAESGTVDLTDIAVSGGNAVWGYPWHHGEGGAWGTAQGVLRTTTDTDTKAADLGGFGSAYLTAAHSHHIDFAWNVGSNFNDGLGRNAGFTFHPGDDGLGMSRTRIYGKVFTLSDGSHQTRGVSWQTNVQPSLVIRHLIKT